MNIFAIFETVNIFRRVSGSDSKMVSIGSDDIFNYFIIFLNIIVIFHCPPSASSFYRVPVESFCFKRSQSFRFHFASS